MATLRYFTVLALLIGATQSQHFNGNGRSEHASNRFNFFDIELLQEIIRQEGAHNFVISPASVKAVVAMLWEGSAGETAHQIQKTLRLEGSSTSHQIVFNTFLQSLKVRHQGTAVEFANQIFVSPDIKVQDVYKQILKNIYYSGTENVDFTMSQLAAATINGWVSRNTHGLIRTLVPPQALDPNTKALVANALYFRGKWAIPFNKQATTVRCFHPVPTECKKAYFMETVGQNGYANLRDLNAKALEIYYQGSKFSMVFLLPNNGIDELLRDLSYQPLNSIIPKLESTTVVVSIPRFSIEYETDLTGCLSKLGVRDLFTPAANLSNMVEKGNVFISKVFQKAVIEIDEEGTVGAAASGAVAVPLQGPILPRFQADKPFLFFVRDIETGNYLFEGLVEQPELVSPSGSSSFESIVPQPSRPTVLKPVPSSQSGPTNSKIDETSFTNSFSSQSHPSFNPQNGAPSDPISYPS